MNVSDLARQLGTNTKVLFEVLPKYGFDIGARAIKVDDKVAAQIIKRWRFIKKELEEQRKKEEEERKRLERELRKQSGHTVSFGEKVTVREFAEKLNLSLTEVITELMKNGILANQNQYIDFDTASIMAGELGFTAEREGGVQTSEPVEDERGAVLEKALANAQNKEVRPPVIVVMGHVDHGKTKLLDTIRETHVIDTESGGITQHIGAYQTVWLDPKTKVERPITFIDTPGHEAFTVMRSRGAKVADIAILVVAADDGVKPQTDEVIQIIRAAKLPFVVAMNKIDKPGADPQRVRSELSARNIIAEDWGGDVPFVEISAKEKLNIDKLLDVLLLVADMRSEEIVADATMPAVGTIIESHKDKNIGPVATVLIQSGTLRKGDPLVVNGEIYGKVRAMRSDRGKELETAPPSTPVQIIGFKAAPEVGDILDVASAASATMIDARAKEMRQTGAERHTIVKAHENDDEDGEGGKKTLDLYIKADVLGSLEAIIGSLEKIKHDEVGVKIVGKGLGNITEGDVEKASNGGATMVGFHVNTTGSSEEMMRTKGVVYMKYEVIYHLIEWVKSELEKMLDSEKIVTEIGNMKIMGIFHTERGAMTVGGRVESGKVIKNCLVNIKRDGQIVGNGKIVKVQQAKSEIKEAPAGTECGIRYEGRDQIMMDDVLEFYTEERKARKIVFEE
jgi:translation initiation factor IF-2